MGQFMVKFVTNIQVDMSDLDVWYGEVESYDSKHITLSSGTITGTYYGDFSFDAYGDIYGRMTGYTSKANGHISSQITGADIDAHEAMELIDSGSANLYKLLFNSSDSITTSKYSDVIYSYAGNDTVHAGAGSDTVYAGSGNDIVYGGSNSDKLFGGNGSDILKGETGNDTLSGETGNDRLYGGSGNDRLSGDIGKDILKGEAGNDKLTGGAGKDTLTGGSGADTFVFLSTSDSKPSASSRDYITDFRLSQNDTIDVSAIDANSHAYGNQSFTFIGSAKFSGDEGELRLSHGNGKTYVSADVNGDKSADFMIALAGNISLHSDDFIL